MVDYSFSLDLCLEKLLFTFISKSLNALDIQNNLCLDVFIGDP